MLGELAGRQDIGCLILLSGKAGNFIAGADVEEIARVTDPLEAEAGSRIGHRLFAAWEALPFPTVAAIRGTCLGGGTELSLASTYRVASDGAATRIGLPEVRLGILPGWGGSTRLPRLIGIAEALDLILTGKTVAGRKALKLGLVDALLPDAALPRRGARLRPASASAEAAARRQRRRLQGAAPRKEPAGPQGGLRPGAQEDPGADPRPLPGAAARHRGGAGGDRGRPRAPASTPRRAPSPSSPPRGCARTWSMSSTSPKRRRRRPGCRAASRAPVRATAVLGAGVMGGGIAQLVSARGRACRCA